MDIVPVKAILLLHLPVELTLLITENMTLHELSAFILANSVVRCILGSVLYRLGARSQRCYLSIAGNIALATSPWPHP